MKQNNCLIQLMMEICLNIFFEDVSPPEGLTKEDYLKELEKEFYKLKIEEAKRLLGLPKK